MIEDCTAIIMAGGDSQRMGRDKANVVLGGQTLLQSVIATMQQLFPQVILSVRKPCTGINLPQVCDAQADGGPLAGLVACLGQITTPWSFMVACDMPFIVPEVVELLAGYRSKPLPTSHCPGRSNRFPPDKGGLRGVGRPVGVLCQAVVPIVHGHPQPLTAFYATSCLAPMRASLAAQQKGLRGVLNQLDVRYVDEAEMLKADPQLRSFFDLDTPQDVEAALSGVR